MDYKLIDIAKEASKIGSKFEEQKWDIKVPIKQNMRHGQAFNPVIQSNHATALILSYVDFKDEVCSLLQSINHQSRAFIVNSNGLPGFLLLSWKPIVVKLPISERQNEANFEFPTPSELSALPLKKRIQLQKIKINASASMTKCMTRLKLYFTNDVKSTSLKGTFYTKFHKETTIEFDTKKEIRKVSLKL